MERKDYVNAPDFESMKELQIPELSFLVQFPILSKMSFVTNIIQHKYSVPWQLSSDSYKIVDKILNNGIEDSELSTFVSLFKSQKYDKKVFISGFDTEFSVKELRTLIQAYVLTSSMHPGYVSPNNSFLGPKQSRQEFISPIVKENKNGDDKSTDQARQYLLSSTCRKFQKLFTNAEFQVLDSLAKKCTKIGVCV